jgi:hypothetical protein
MELLVGRNNRVYFDQESGVDVSGASWKFDGVAQPALPAPVLSGSRYAVDIPYLAREGEVELTWNLNVTGSGVATRIDYYDAVTPYLSKYDLDRLIAVSETDITAEELESAVRNIINAHTGQAFGLSEKTIVVYGDDGLKLKLPERLVEINSITSYPYVNRMRIIGGGWWLQVVGNPYYVPPVRADYDGWNEFSAAHVSSSGVPIGFPGAHFKHGQAYEINGKWGWKAVPHPVKSAARIIAEDAVSLESKYRDKSIRSISAADWRLEFEAGAFANLGNINAEQLLADYIVPRGMGLL